MALRDWRPVLVGRRLLDQLPLNGLEVRVLGPEDSTFRSRLMWKASTALHFMAPHIRRLLKAEQASLVHAHFGPDSLDAWPLARALELPMLVTLHGYDINTHRVWWEAGNAGSGMRHYPQRLLQLATQPGVGFIAVSEAIRRRAIDFGIPAEKIAVNYIGIDTGRFTPGAIPIGQRPRDVLFVGRLVEKKGCRHVIEAMSVVQSEVPDARLVVIGDGPLRQDLEALARSLRVQVDFRGALGTAEVQRALGKSRVLCLPSVTAANGDAEGFGLVLLEAQASGVPVVTSARGGADEGIREGVTGYAFAEGDTAVLAARLTSLLTDDAMLQRMAEQGSRYVVEHFDVLHCASGLETLYDTAVLRH
ncbi:glycosyltransferase [Povalibacter sp.]|uniref:glycosyltransferase n=1 Tax=Povalibacter sp. TaxID=1962978 RepID=UPI002F40F79B